MKFVRTSVINLTAEESETLIAASNLLGSICKGMDSYERVFDCDDCSIKDLANVLLDAGTHGVIVVTRDIKF